jgi:hypothetical protein
MEIDTEELTKTYTEFTDKELLRRDASGNLTDIAYDISDSNCPI